MDRFDKASGVFLLRTHFNSSSVCKGAIVNLFCQMKWTETSEHSKHFLLEASPSDTSAFLNT